MSHRVWKVSWEGRKKSVCIVVPDHYTTEQVCKMLEQHEDEWQLGKSDEVEDIGPLMFGWSTHLNRVERALDRACQWLHEWNTDNNLGCGLASPRTFKVYFLDDEFHARMDQHRKKWIEENGGK